MKLKCTIGKLILSRLWKLCDVFTDLRAMKTLTYMINRAVLKVGLLVYSHCDLTKNYVNY